MQTTSTDEWVEWAAHNLALGVAESKVRDEMVLGGLSDAQASAVVDEILGSAIYRAAKRVGGDLRKWTVLSDALLELKAQSFAPTEVPRVANLSSEAFLRDYYALNRPVIIVDVVDTWPARAKWCLDFFREQYGDETVTYQKGRSDVDYREAFIDHGVTGPFSEYIDLIAAGKITNDYYLIAHDRLLDRPRFAPLLNDIGFDDRYFDGVDTHGRVFFWLGPKGSITPMHRDLGNVYLAQIMGRKSIKLIPSTQMHRVYNSVGYHSDVDFENYSQQDYPLLRDAHIAEVVINPGEMLFIPLGWWHHVKALDVSVSITGNNFRFNNVFTPIF